MRMLARDCPGDQNGEPIGRRFDTALWYKIMYYGPNKELF